MDLLSRFSAEASAIRGKLSNLFTKRGRMRVRRAFAAGPPSEVLVTTEAELLEELRRPAAEQLVSLELVADEGSEWTLTHVPRDVGELVTLRFLALACQTIATLPDSGFPVFANLHGLDLSHNALVTKSLGPIWRMHSLTALSLSNNQIDLIDEQIVHLRSLTRLECSHNKIAHVPGVLFSMPALTHLALDNNKLEQLPALRHGDALAPLRGVDLSHNALHGLPDYVFHLATLVSLDVSHNKLAALHNVPLQWASLQSLDLSDNALTAVPDDWSRATSIVDLNLGNNKLRTLPESFGALQQMRALCIAGNKFTALPACCLRSPALSLLDVSRNALTTLPMSFGECQQIKTLRLAETKIVDLPPSVTRLPLEELDIAKTSVKSLPVEFSQLASLTLLKLTYFAIPSGIRAQDVTAESVKYLVELARTSHHPIFALTFGAILSISPTNSALLLSKDALAVFLSYIHSSLPAVQMAMMRIFASLFNQPDAADIVIRAGVLGELVPLLRPDLPCDAMLSLLQAISSLVQAAVSTEQVPFAALTESVARVAAHAAQSPPADVLRHALLCLAYIALLDVKCALAVAAAHEHLVADAGLRARAGELAEYEVLLRALGVNEAMAERVRRRGLRVLAIDGGGTRGIAVVQMLRVFERTAGKRVHEMFDVIGGTSTGGLLAFALAAREVTLDELEAIYRELAKEVFTHGNQQSVIMKLKAVYSSSSVNELARYSSTTFEKLIRERLGDAPLMSCHRTLPPRSLPFCVASMISFSPPMPFVFRTYAQPPTSPSRYNGSSLCDLVTAMRATSAAPTYFAEVVHHGNQLVDGGAASNNPAGIALHEARRLFPGAPLQCLVSMGTGRSRTPEAMADKRLLQRLLVTLVESATDVEAVHCALEETLSDERYFRFNPVDDAFACSLDETNPGKLQAMSDAAERYMTSHEQQPRVEALARALAGD